MEKISWGFHEPSETSRGPSGDPPGTSRGPPGDPRGSPWDPLGRPRGSQGTPGDLQGPLMELLWIPYGPLMDDKNGHISTTVQRQKLSIPVFEAAHQGPSHGGPDRAIFSIKRLPKSKNVPLVPGFCFRTPPSAPGLGTPVIYRYIYIHIYIYIYIWQRLS